MQKGVIDKSASVPVNQSTKISAAIEGVTITPGITPNNHEIHTSEYRDL